MAHVVFLLDGATLHSYLNFSGILMPINMFPLLEEWLKVVKCPPTKHEILS
jgi:hypothetical protein